MVSAASPVRLASPMGVLFALLAAAALLQSTLLVMIDPALLGWRPDHGHVFLQGRPHAHAHPASNGGFPTPPDVVFTPESEGALGTVVGAVTVPVVEVMLPAPLPPIIIESVVASVPLDAPTDVSVPPPRD